MIRNSFAKEFYQQPGFEQIEASICIQFVKPLCCRCIALQGCFH